MSAAVTGEAIEKELEGFRQQLAQAGHVYARQARRIEDLRFEADEAGLARDRALYWLFRFCEAAEREQWPLSEEAREIKEHALNVLFDNNIFVSLDEPDAAILRLMEIVAPDLEANEEGGGD